MVLPISFVDWLDSYRVFRGKADQSAEKAPAPSGDTTPRQNGSIPPEDPAFAEKGEVDNSKVRLFTPRIFAMAMVVSIGGLIFGYDVGFSLRTAVCAASILTDNRLDKSQASWR